MDSDFITFFQGCIGGGARGGAKPPLVKVLGQVGGGAQPPFIITKDSILIIQNLNDYSSRHGTHL